MIDKVLAKDLRRKGWTYQKIGDLFGISRQRIQQITGRIGKSRTYKKSRLLASELRAMKILKRRGLKVTPATFHDTVDLWIDTDSKRYGVEVKERNPKARAKNIHKNNYSDYLFLIMGDEWYFIPTSELNEVWEPRTKYKYDCKHKRILDKYHCRIDLV